VRAGSGNEADRLTLLRQHRQRVSAQIAALEECLKLINVKVQLYEGSLADGFPDPLITPSPPTG
jgi:hypothetical protein